VARLASARPGCYKERVRASGLPEGRQEGAVDTLAGIASTSFIIGLSGAMMPGPVLTVTIGEAGRRGFAAGPLIVLGHGILELALVIGLTLGLGALLTREPVIGAIGLVGGAMLLWMGAAMLRSLPGLSLRWERAEAPRGGLHPVLAGILTSVANPYWTLWWATIGLGYVALAGRLGTVGLVSFYTGHILSDLAWYSFVAAGVSVGRRLLTDRAYRGLVGCCAVALLGFGLYFGYRGALRLP
jgi:threonine/homoserine/homoserine lactone efflux protein